jgi:hypothetical protein
MSAIIRAANKKLFPDYVDTFTSGNIEESKKCLEQFNTGLLDAFRIKHGSECVAQSFILRNMAVLELLVRKLVNYDYSIRRWFSTEELTEILEYSIENKHYKSLHEMLLDAKRAGSYTYLSQIIVRIIISTDTDYETTLSKSNIVISEDQGSYSAYLEAGAMSGNYILINKYFSKYPHIEGEEDEIIQKAIVQCLRKIDNIEIIKLLFGKFSIVKEKLELDSIINTALEYGRRNALDWIIDHYKIGTNYIKHANLELCDHIYRFNDNMNNYISSIEYILKFKKQVITKGHISRLLTVGSDICVEDTLRYKLLQVYIRYCKEDMDFIDDDLGPVDYGIPEQYFIRYIRDPTINKNCLKLFNCILEWYSGDNDVLLFKRSDYVEIATHSAMEDCRTHELVVNGSSYIRVYTEWYQAQIQNLLDFLPMDLCNQIMNDDV